METGQGLRIAIYSQDGFGLGHMQRTCSIAWEIYRLRSEASILTFSDSQLGQFFPISPHHDYIKLPSIAKNGPGNWQATHLRVSFPEILQLRQQLISNVLLNYAPDIFLMDHMPHGTMGELLPALEAVDRAGVHTRNVLGLRDILDSPEVTINRWEVEGTYDVIEHYYARILVFGMQDVYDIAEKYQLPESVAKKRSYCGYVSNLDSDRNAHNIRTRYLADKSADTLLIVVMAGGGVDAYPMMEQRTRAKLFRDRHWVDTIDPDELTSDTLAESISAHLSNPNRSKPNALPNLNGAAVAAKHTLAVLASKKERVP